MSNYKEHDLIIDIDYNSVIVEEDVKEFKQLQQRFIKSFTDNKDKLDIGQWLTSELKDNLAEKSELEIKEISNEIIETLKINEEKQKSLTKAIKNGRSKESWFAANLKQSTSYMTSAQTAKYLHELDEAIKSANQAMYNTIITKSGAIN